MLLFLVLPHDFVLMYNEPLLWISLALASFLDLRQEPSYIICIFILCLELLFLMFKIGLDAVQDT